MNIYNVYYTLKSKDENKYIVLADFHGVFNLKLAKEIQKHSAKYVIIAGDILNGREWTNHKKINKLKSFLNIIKTNKKIIICLGNHDLWNLTEEGLKNFKNLKDDNIYPLYNETIVIDNNTFTNYLPEASTFSYPMQDSKKTINKLLKAYDKRFTKPDKKYINHLISHNPYHFLHNEVINTISKNYDFIETGHFHDGWVPTKFLNKSLNWCLDKGIQEIINNILLFTNRNSLHVKLRRNLSRGIAYIYEEGYYILLPNNNIYYYDRVNNKYTLSSQDELIKRLDKEKVPALIITGAVNTFKKMKMFYPYLTNIKLVKDNIFKAKHLINYIDK